MAIDPHTAKIIAQAVISQITDEEKRQRLIIGIIITIVIIVFILLIPVFAITSTIDKIKSFFGFGDDGTTSDSSYYSLVEMHDTYAPTLTVGELEYNGTFPMPVQGATVTSEFGSRVHPVTGKQSFHTGIDLAGVWHSNITSVNSGNVVWAGVQSGYGNCVEVQHTTESGTVYYTFYAHLARIDWIYVKFLDTFFYEFLQINFLVCQFFNRIIKFIYTKYFIILLKTIIAFSELLYS